MADHSKQDKKSTSYWAIFAADRDGRIARNIRTTIGGIFGKLYSKVIEERLPPTIADLLRRLQDGAGR